jgi:hypothetical protein
MNIETTQISIDHEPAGTLADFIRMNEMTGDEITRLVNDLKESGFSLAGGGAAPWFEIHIVKGE